MLFKPGPHRMYVDEVGNHDLKACQDPNHRYLSLTGVIFRLDYVDSVVAPELEALKRRHFKAHVDEPIILHRKELVNRNYPFNCLREPGREDAFNSDLLNLLTHLDYRVVTAAIDKLEHVTRYPVWQYHPYHYCQAVLVERFAMWLNRRYCTGDVYGESRGRNEDKALKNAFRFIYNNGTDWVKKEEIQRAIIEKEIKLKRKGDNIAGLQIADLIAHPSFKAMLARRRKEAPPATFGGKVAQILEKAKYDRSSSGKIEGWGWKWLP